jgi:epoxide hydrolase-like predicted phosphatase
MIKAVIFDCFGVIIADGFSVVLNELRQTNPKAVDFINPLMEMVMNGDLSVEESSTMIAEYLGTTYEEWRARIHQHESKDTTLMEFIKSLRADYKTGLLSNVGKGGLDRRFSRDELSSCFDVVIASGEVGLVKPQHKIYELTANKLGVQASECIFIDDIEVYCIAASETGMQAIQYKNLSQLKTDLEKILS